MLGKRECLAVETARRVRCGCETCVRAPLPRPSRLYSTMRNPRCFPPPWTVEETDACIAYIYFEDEPGRRSASKLSCAALAVPKRFQEDPQVSRLLVTQLDGYRRQLAFNSGRQNHFCVAAESLASIFSITGNTLGSVLSILTVMASLNHQPSVIIRDPHKVLRAGIVWKRLDSLALVDKSKFSHGARSGSPSPW